MKARIDDAAMFEAIVTAIDAHAKPRTKDDDRGLAQRQAEAVADICGYVLHHGELPECGGHRPQVNVLIRLEDLEARARAAMLDFAGSPSATMMRMLACDAAVIPVVLGGAGQPLDVGRLTRTSRTGSAGQWPPEILVARTPAAADRGRGARCTTSWPGRTAARPPCTTASCCARSITARSTAPSGWSASATGCPSSSRRSGSTDIARLDERHSHTSSLYDQSRRRSAGYAAESRSVFRHGAGGSAGIAAQRAPRLNEHHGPAGTAAQRAPRLSGHRGPTSTAAQRAPRPSGHRAAQRVSRPRTWAASWARCSGSAPGPVTPDWRSWVRQLNPSASTAVPGAALRTAGSSTRSAQAIDTS